MEELSAFRIQAVQALRWSLYFFTQLTTNPIVLESAHQAAKTIEQHCYLQLLCLETYLCLKSHRVFRLRHIANQV